LNPVGFGFKRNYNVFYRTGKYYSFVFAFIFYWLKNTLTGLKYCHQEKNDNLWMGNNVSSFRLDENTFQSNVPEISNWNVCTKNEVRNMEMEYNYTFMHNHFITQFFVLKFRNNTTLLWVFRNGELRKYFILSFVLSISWLSSKSKHIIIRSTF